MKNACISVIVPVYNLEAYLPRCLDSILTQTHSELEIICVDDGSKDKSGRILDAYAEKDARIKVLHKENGGVSAARADGIAAATGDYIGFVDGDDEIEPTMYERLLDNLLNYTADIAHCGHRVVYPDGREKLFRGTGRLDVQNREAALKALLNGEIEPGLCNKLFRASILKKLTTGDKLAQGIRINEDLLINFYAFSAADTLVYEDVCPYRYMKREGSASMATLNTHRVRDPLLVKERILEACRGTPLESTARAAFLSTHLHMYNNLLLAEDPQLEKDRVRVRETIKNHRIDARLLSTKQRVFRFLIVHCPRIYKAIYRLYSR